MLEELNGLAVKLEEFKTKYIEEATKALEPALQSVFIKEPKIKAYGWAQYTPYFNDGEPCEFSVNGLLVSFGEGNPENFEENEGWHYVYSSMALPEEIDCSVIQTLTELEKTLSRSEDVLKAAFGDHCRVIVQSSGVDVEEYDHE